MKALIQRVSSAAVYVDDQCTGSIDSGLLVFLGVERGDTTEKADHLLKRVLGYRIFPDEQGRMNISLQAFGGGLLIVPQFTLAADTQRGMRPSFTPAAPPELGQVLFDYYLKQAHNQHQPVACGQFGANMQVKLTNNGPVTFLL